MFVSDTSADKDRVLYRFKAAMRDYFPVTSPCRLGGHPEPTINRHRKPDGGANIRPFSDMERDFSSRATCDGRG